MKEAPSLRTSLLRELPRHRLHFRICMRKTDGYRACAGKAPFGGGKNRKTKNRTCAKISGLVFCLDNGAAPRLPAAQDVCKTSSVFGASPFAFRNVGCFPRHGGLPVSHRNPRSCHFSSVHPRFRPRDGNGTFPAAALRPAQESRIWIICGQECGSRESSRGREAWREGPPFKGVPLSKVFSLPKTHLRYKCLICLSVRFFSRLISISRCSAILTSSQKLLIDDETSTRLFPSEPYRTI